MITYLNDSRATIEDLAPLAFAGHAHFTAMQVRAGRVRGLDLHLGRLRAASRELFGGFVPEATLRARLGAALTAGPPDASVTVVVSETSGEFASRGEGLQSLIRVGAPAQAPPGPLDLDLVPHERYLPHVKHVGEVAKTHLLRRALARGFDDAAFLDASGRVSEATIWNLAFWDGESVIWPRAAVLAGVTMQILRRRLTHRGVPQEEREVRPGDLPGLAAVVMNSWSPGVPIRRMGEAGLPDASELSALLHSAYAEEPPEAP